MRYKLDKHKIDLPMYIIFRILEEQQFLKADESKRISSYLKESE